MVMHGLHRDHHRYDRSWPIEAMDAKQVELYTDCRSLEEYVNQSGLHSVSDKRLAIDLTGIRQQILRRQRGDWKSIDHGSTATGWNDATPLDLHRKDGGRLPYKGYEDRNIGRCHEWRLDGFHARKRKGM